MSALPQSSPLPQSLPRLLTVAEYAELGEWEPGYTELVEGRLVVSPSPVPDHNVAAIEMLKQLLPQLPDHLEVILDIDVDLALAPAGQPGFSRRPDLVVVERSARERVRAEGGLLRATEVVVIVEVLSPTSRRTDRVVKRGEYADAGIPHYWIVDPVPPVSLLACRRTGGGGYADTAWAGTVSLPEPFPLRLDLEHLGSSRPQVPPAHERETERRPA